jgi:predicted nucleotidyltransferase
MNTDTSTTADEVIASLRAHASELRAAGIRHLALFGSVARGEAGADSDIDLAVELDPEAHITLIGLIGLESKLGELLGRRVDLLPEPIHRPRLRANVDRDRRHAF